MTDLTTRAALIVGLAVVALLSAGWRKPARATPRPPRGRHDLLGHHPHRTATATVAVTELDAPDDHRTPAWRRAWAVLATATLTVVVGAVVATVVGYSVAWSVTTLTDLLKD